MTIETKRSPGDKVWIAAWPEPRELTVGQVRVCVTDTPGLDLGDGISWDNFKEERSYVEEYMCVETGVGSGSVYTYGKHAFLSRVEAEAALAALQRRTVVEGRRA